MIEVPPSVIEAVRTAMLANLDSVANASEAAIAAVRALDDFDDVSHMLIDLAIQELVYRARTQNNAAVEQEVARAAYTGPAKVNVGKSAAVNRVAQSVYNHAIGGTSLGELTGEELERIAMTEAEIAKGHQFNAALCKWCLSKGVKAGQRVRDVIKKKDLEQAFRRLKEKVGKDQVKAAKVA